MQYILATSYKIVHTSINKTDGLKCKFQTIYAWTYIYKHWSYFEVSFDNT